METAEKHINPITDFGFKRILGDGPNKDLLLDFLNEQLKDEEGEITDLTYLKMSMLGQRNLDKETNMYKAHHNDDDVPCTYWLFVSP